MITTVKINSLEQVMELAFQQEYDQSIDRFRNTYFYRGLNNSNYNLITSLQRVCGNKAAQLEPYMLRNFAKYASIDDPTVNDSEWKAMIVGQHHGLPTRLMDWTISIPMALHFATTENDLSQMEAHDCAVWRYDAQEIKNLLPVKIQAGMQASTVIFSLKDLEGVISGIDEYDRLLTNKAFITLEPPSIDQRIVSQFSYFTILPAGITDMIDYLDKNTNNTVQYIIDKSLRWQIRDTLDQWNISERTVFPGLDGLAAWLRRYYYVR